ncbi:MAG: NAD-dependent epimerase/dehydratase family protein [Proteobacteria bacterium]|nr:NAD-dependent epimerase/dehydratase family protein [Pseudomonadota bacterium]
MKILVTGGAGFIGSNVVDGYIEAGHEVVVVDNLFTGKRENLNPKAKFYEIDIRSKELLDIFKAEKPEVVNHHAAQISVPGSVKDPIFDAEVNVLGFLNVLEVVRQSEVRKVIFISSGGAIYGEADEYPTTEAYQPQPLSPYAITKAVSENYLNFYSRQYGLDYTTLRYANVYGPRQIPNGEAGVVAIFMDNLLSGTPSTLFHFADEPRGMTRDYCFAGDVARANLLALETGNGIAFNIGTTVATHTAELYAATYAVAKEAVPGLSAELETLKTAAARPGDLTKSSLNAERARSGLGWEPQVDLKEGLRRTLEWRMNR